MDRGQGDQMVIINDQQHLLGKGRERIEQVGDD